MNWSKEYVQARVVRNTQAFESFIGQLRHAAKLLPLVKPFLKTLLAIKTKLRPRQA